MNRPRVLIIDTDEAVLMELERRLEDNGFETSSTYSAQEAIDQLGLRRYHGLIVAHKPPQIDSEQLLRRASEIPAVVVCSGPQPGAELCCDSHWGARVISKWDYHAIVEAAQETFRPGKQRAPEAPGWCRCCARARNQGLPEAQYGCCGKRKTNMAAQCECGCTERQRSRSSEVALQGQLPRRSVR